MRGEAIVVGAGPAGLSAALGLARSGVRVIVLEQHVAWPGRVCGGFLNPEGVRHLQALGTLNAVAAAGAVPITSARVTTPGGLDRAVAVTVGGMSGFGVPRRVLEDVLLEQARLAGVTIRTGVRVTGLRRSGRLWTVAARLAGQPAVFEADLVVLGDGRFSIAAPPVSKVRVGWFGWNATFAEVRQSPGDLSMHFFQGGYVGALTFSDGSTNVCGLTFLNEDRPRTWEARWAHVITRQPALARLVRDATRVSEWRGVGPLPFSTSMRQSTGPVLAGDAAAVGDPYMGEGISRALGTGPILQQALASDVAGPLDAEAIRLAYEQVWRRRYTARLRLGMVTRRFQRRTRLFHAVLATVTHQPLLMRSLRRVFHPAGPV